MPSFIILALTVTIFLTNSAYAFESDKGEFEPGYGTVPAPEVSHRPRLVEPVSPQKSYFEEDDVLQDIEQVFGTASRAVANVVRQVFADLGQPSAIIKGEEGGGAFVAGITFGSGNMYMQSGVTPIYWRGPSIGYDFGANASKVYMLVYNANRPHKMYRRFGSIGGHAYFIGGGSTDLSVSANQMESGGIILVPIRAGLGLRMGANLNSMIFSRSREYNPFW